MARKSRSLAMRTVDRVTVATPRARAPSQRARSRSRSRSRGLVSVLKTPRVKTQRPKRSGKDPQQMQSVAAAYATGQSTSPPMIQASRDQCRIIHRELVASVVGSTAFAVPIQLALQPGISASFPWLSTQAQGWEQYRFNRLNFCYYTRTGSNVPGSMMLIPDYDALDAAPITEQIASSYEDVEEDAPWKDIHCVLRPSSLHSLGPRKYVRTAALPANADLKTYDCGNLFVGTVDGTAVNWGKLWVEYDVTFYVPQLPPTGGSQLASQSAEGTAAMGGVPTTAANFGVAPTVVVSGPTLFSISGNVMTILQLGRFLLAVQTTGTTVTVTAAVVPGAGITLDPNIGYIASGLMTAGSTTNSVVQNVFFTVTSLSAATLTFDNTIAGGTSATALLVQAPASGP
jgi:hypothetical protein